MVAYGPTKTDPETRTTTQWYSVLSIQNGNCSLPMQLACDRVLPVVRRCTGVATDKCSAGWLHGVFVGEWLFVFPLCGFSLSLFCNYKCSAPLDIELSPRRTSSQKQRMARSGAFNDVEWSSQSCSGKLCARGIIAPAARPLCIRDRYLTHFLHRESVSLVIDLSGMVPHRARYLLVP